MNSGILFSFASLILYGLWGFSYKLLAKQGISGEWSVSIIMLFGAIFTMFLAVAKQEQFPQISSWSVWVLVLAVATAGALGNVFLIKAMGVPGFSAGVGLSISAAYPLIAALLALLFLKEHMGLHQWLGVALVVAGVSLLSVEKI